MSHGVSQFIFPHNLSVSLNCGTHAAKHKTLFKRPKHVKSCTAELFQIRGSADLDLGKSQNYLSLRLPNSSLGGESISESTGAIPRSPGTKRGLFVLDEETCMSLNWERTSFTGANPFLTLSESAIEYRTTIPFTEEQCTWEDRRTFSSTRSCQLMLSQDMPPKSSNADYESWRSFYVFIHRGLRQFLYPPFLEAQYNHLHITTCVTWSCRVRKTIQIGTQKILKLPWLESRCLYWRATRETATDTFVRKASWNHWKPTCT